ncbi:hypothetical protein HDU91_001962 [Kappamyces sp. JEL0680]|nr:hypothetical protein HDU91_001962 [Kappamyces sp. JEL0680]
MPIDRTFCFILIGQVVVAVSYLLLIFLTNFSNVYGSDKTAMAMNGVETFQESLHSVLNFMMVERMPFFVRRSNLINNESKPFKTTQADGSSNPLSGQVATVLDS